MKEQPMVLSPTFEVNLGGIDLTEPQAKELEKAIQQATMQFLAKLDSGFLKDVYEFTPHPDPNGDPNPQPNLLRNRKWWFGKKLLRLRNNQRIEASILSQITRPDIAQTFQLNQLQMP